MSGEEPPLHRPEGGRGEVAALFLKLGLIGFGGPAAHIALMRQEAVQRRHWVSEQQFLDLVGAANLVPGPSSTEVAIFLGYIRAGWQGLALAGAFFILPAMLIVLAFAWAYARFGTTPGVAALLYGIKPVIVAVIFQALWGLGKSAVKTAWLAGVVLAVFALYFVGVSPVVLLFGGALLVLAIQNAARLREMRRSMRLWLLPGQLLPLAAAASAGSIPFSLVTLFLTFLKIGAVVFGSGYVLLAFLRADFVVRLGWLTDRQLLDAVAVGQFTPGPVFTTATFIGYLVGSWAGALLATLAIFLPAFVFVPVVYPLVPRLRASPWARGFLDGANASALGLMAAVTWQLGQAALVDPLTVALALLSGVLLIRGRVNSVWLIVAGALIGLARTRLL